MADIIEVEVGETEDFEIGDDGDRKFSLTILINC